MVDLMRIAKEVNDALEEGLRLQMELGEVAADPEVVCWTIWQHANWISDSAQDLWHLGDPSLDAVVSALDTASAKLRNALDRYRCECTEN